MKKPSSKTMIGSLLIASASLFAMSAPANTETLSKELNDVVDHNEAQNSMFASQMYELQKNRLCQALELTKDHHKMIRQIIDGEDVAVTQSTPAYLIKNISSYDKTALSAYLEEQKQAMIDLEMQVNETFLTYAPDSLKNSSQATQDPCGQ